MGLQCPVWRAPKDRLVGELGQIILVYLNL